MRIADATFFISSISRCLGSRRRSLSFLDFDFLCLLLHKTNKRKLTKVPSSTNRTKDEKIVSSHQHDIKQINKSPVEHQQDRRWKIQSPAKLKMGWKIQFPAVERQQDLLTCLCEARGRNCGKFLFVATIKTNNCFCWFVGILIKRSEKWRALRLHQIRLHAIRW